MKYLLFTFLLLAGIQPLRSQSIPTETEKIATFCKVWGFLKYYHPVVADGKYDWDHEFTTRVHRVATLTSKAEVNQYYADWINGLGPIKPCKKCRPVDDTQIMVNFDLNWLQDEQIFTTDVIQLLQNIQTNRHRGDLYYVQQSKSVGNTIYENEKTYADSVFPSPSLRLLSLSRYWNIIQYFFPYKYKISQNWNDVLTEMVPKFKDAPDTIAYHMAMLELTAKINDSHAGMVTPYINRFFGLKWAPFKYKLIDNKAVVTGFYNDSLCQIHDIQYGDVVLKVGQETIADRIKANAPYTGASNEAAQLRNMTYCIFNGQTDSIRITFERNGTVSEKTIGRYFFKNFKYDYKKQPQKETYKLLPNNIGYVNLDLLQRDEVNQALKTLKNTQAIIFDVRGYANGTMYYIADFLNSKAQPFVKFSNPNLSYPGTFSYTKTMRCGRKNPDYYKGQVVLLVNEYAQSHSEFTLMALQTAPNVVIIGSPSAGADGNVSAIIFPGGYKTMMTGIGVFYPDGRETQRVGIVPDITIRPTIEGVKMRKDEVLDRAIRFILDKETVPKK